jgi:hypothetical protein
MPSAILGAPESAICRHRRLGVRPLGALGALARSTRCQRPAMPLGSAQLPWSGRCAASRLACVRRRGGASPTAPGCAAARCIRALPPCWRARRRLCCATGAARRPAGRRPGESRAGLTRCDGGKSHPPTGTTQPHQCKGQRGGKGTFFLVRALWVRLGIRLQQVMPAIPPCAGTRSQPADRHIVPLRCCIFLLYKARERWAQDFEFISLTWGGATGFEPRTSCMPSAGSTSTAVRLCRSPSQEVRARPVKSAPVAVLSCCTSQPARSGSQ